MNRPEVQTLLQELADLKTLNRSDLEIQNHFYKHAHGKGGNAAVDLSRSQFIDLAMDGFNFAGLDLSGSTFKGCSLTNAHFERSILTVSEFEGGDTKLTDCTGANFTNAKAFSATFDCVLRNATFSGANLAGSRFPRADLRGARFEGCDLRDTNFGESIATTTTVFTDLPSTAGMRMTRYMLACLGPNFGGLTEGNRMQMKTLDDASQMRSAFGGFWAILHTAAVVIFLLPYVKFLISKSITARFNRDPSDSVTLFRALGRFIASGGESYQKDWQINYFSLTAFVAFLLYNVCRVLLLWKTKTLETHQEVTGLPAKFSFVDDQYEVSGESGRCRKCYRWTMRNRWYLAYNIVKFMVVVAIISVAYNTWHFLQQQIPV